MRPWGPALRAISRPKASPHQPKEEEKGTTRVNFERSNEALGTGAGIVAAACPFCNTMLTDGVKHAEKEEAVRVMDIAELIAASMS